MNDKERELEVKRIALEMRQKLKEQQDREDDKETKIKDPLCNQKAIIKHFGTHNRLR